MGDSEDEVSLNVMCLDSSCIVYTIVYVYRCRNHRRCLRIINNYTSIVNGQILFRRVVRIIIYNKMIIVIRLYIRAHGQNERENKRISRRR